MQSISPSASRHDETAAAMAGSLGASAASGASSGREDRDFSRMLSGLMETPAAEITPNLDVHTDWKAGEHDQTLLAASDPYAGRNDVEDAFSNASALGDAVSAPTADIRLTDAEVRKIADNLRKSGADAETVKRVEELAGHPGGASVAEVVRAVAREEPAKLTEGDLTRIEALAAQLDPSGELGKAVLANLRNGEALQAWASLGNALEGLEPGTELSVDRQQLLSLGKALRLGQSTLSMLDASFGGADGLALTPAGLKKLMAPAAQELADKAAARETLVSSLEDAMKPVIRDARKRLEAEAQAGGRALRRTEQSKTLIEDTVTRNGFARKEGAAADQARAGRDAAEPAGTPETGRERRTRPAEAASGKDASAGDNAAGAIGRDAGTNARSGSAAAEKGAGEQAGPRPGESAGQPSVRAQGGAQGQGGTGGAFDARDGDRPSGDADASARPGALLDKASGAGAGRAAAPAETPSNPWESLLDRLSAVQGPGAVTPAAAADPAKSAALRSPSPYSGQVLSQVEKGMLTALGNGARRLELQLNPLDLGGVNVLLTTRNGEVSALLRPERPETASLLAQQLGELRASLEEQGVKVDRVDVQTQLKDEQGMTWQGMDQHNAARDQQDRVLDLERLRRLSRGSGAAGPAGIDAARAEAGGAGMRLSPGGGLHLVA